MIVSPKLGGHGAAVILEISVSCSVIAQSKAGGKCSGRIRSNGGIPKGVSQDSKNGFSLISLSL